MASRSLECCSDFQDCILLFYLQSLRWLSVVHWIWRQKNVISFIFLVISCHNFCHRNYLRLAIHKYSCIRGWEGSNKPFMDGRQLKNHILPTCTLYHLSHYRRSCYFSWQTHLEYMLLRNVMFFSIIYRHGEYGLTCIIITSITSRKCLINWKRSVSADAKSYTL